MADLAVLLVEVTADRIGNQCADDAGFLPGLLQGVFGGGLARLDQAFGDDPAAAVAGGDESDFSGVDGGGGGVGSELSYDGHVMHPDREKRYQTHSMGRQ